MSKKENVQAICYYGIDIDPNELRFLSFEECLSLLRREYLATFDEWIRYRKHQPKADENKCRGRFVRKRANDHKYVILRERETEALTFFFVVNYPDTFRQLAQYARSACTYEQRQSDWICCGNFWLDWYNGSISDNQLCLDVSTKHLPFEAKLYWHEALADTVRQQLAEHFGAYVCFNVSFMRQSWPARWDEEKAAESQADFPIILDY